MFYKVNLEFCPLYGVLKPFDLMQWLPFRNGERDYQLKIIKNFTLIPGKSVTKKALNKELKVRVICEFHSNEYFSC